MHDLQAARGASLSLSATRAWIVTLAVAGGGLAADIVTKALAVGHLSDRAPVHLIGSLLQLSFTRNPGAAFSTGTAFTPLLTVVAIVAAVGVLVFQRRVRSSIWAIAMGLLLAGILGNLSDRMFRPPSPFNGHVVDFIALPHWPIFNIADVCINIAALLVVIQVLRGVHADGSRESRGDNSA